MKQQTAVEWLVEQLKEYDYEDFDSDYFEFKIPIWVFAEKVKEAKAMEKEQIVNAWDLSRRDIDYPADGEKYYNNNYNK